MASATILRDFVRAQMLGRSEAFQRVMGLVELVSGTDAPVLISGETGTGKELTARAIHYVGARREKPFVPINCGALPDTLLESELFGHSQGAFTGARQARRGLVAEADGGTLFLDELETLSPRGQVALLRFLEDFTFRAVGDCTLQRVNVRILSAVNIDLVAAANAGTFRTDLLYRLAVLSFTLPPLRERGQDKLLLAEHFVREFASRYEQPPRPLHPDLRAVIEAHQWPGNVRELKNFIHSALVMSRGNTIVLPMTGLLSPVDAVRRTRPPSAQTTANEPLNTGKARVAAEFERNYILRVLKQTQGNVSRAARLAGKDRRSFTRLMKTHGVDVRALRE